MGLHQCPSERKGEGAPVRSLGVPSHVPSHPQTAAKVRGFSRTASGLTAETDWLLEESGFEPLVPLATEMLIELARGISKQLGCRRSATWGRCRGCVDSEVGPAVRIRFPPAASLSQRWTPGLRAKSPTLWRHSAAGLGREKGRAGFEPGLRRAFSLTGIDAVPPHGSSTICT